MEVTDDIQGEAFVDAVKFQGPVEGLTHGLYKYPARFSPVFVRNAIETFTEEGDVVLDPFVGGGTTLVEARLAGRHAYGADISSLAVFLSKTKVVPLSEADLTFVDKWVTTALKRMNIRRQSNRIQSAEFADYDRNMPWQLRKLCEQYLESIDRLPSLRHKRFARCILLRCGQWAMDCRDRIPSTNEFRETLKEVHEDAVAGMREYRVQLQRQLRVQDEGLHCRCVQSPAAKLRPSSFGKNFSKADVVITSPPYPGVHVLYHRWNVKTRRETPAPFWLANCQDGHGGNHYTFGGRHTHKLPKYFEDLRESYQSVGRLLKKDGLVVQMVAFNEKDWQLRAYLSAMNQAGFSEVMPEELGLPSKRRLWRSVPGRRWYSQIRGKIQSSKEVVLFHRNSPS